MNKCNLEQIFLKYNRKNVDIEWGRPSDMCHIKRLESDKKIFLIEELKEFYTYSNGLKIFEPKLIIYKLDKLILKNNLLIFCLIDGKHELAFNLNSNRINSQWDIVLVENNYIITYTFASFLFNKMQKWIDNKIKFWEPPK